MFLGRCTFKEAVATSVGWNYVMPWNGMMMAYKRRPSFSLIALSSRFWIYSVSAIRIRVIPNIIYLGIIGTKHVRDGNQSMNVVETRFR